MRGCPKGPMRIRPEMIEVCMKRPRAAAAKLTAAQFRMLQRIPDDGLPHTALLREGHGYDVAAQLRTLRTLIPLGLVVETRGNGGESRFEITDAGRRLVEVDGAR